MKLWSLNRVARYLSVTPNKVRSYMRDGDLHPIDECESADPIFRKADVRELRKLLRDVPDPHRLSPDRPGPTPAAPPPCSHCGQVYGCLGSCERGPE